ncbi:MAG: hypothetical protein CMJ31_09475 [Phycisphaerae bacterium]|nr:hypothetical protein [Phycisphaerae bacterium]
MRLIGWSTYLACSWTWCIGMFLPALLMRDFGWWGFVVFAVPNIVGAAAMGFLAPGGEKLRAWTETHASAIAWFTRVTIGFHLYFAGMLIDRPLPFWSLPLAAILIVLMISAARLRPSTFVRSSATVLLGSLVFGAGLMITGPTPDHAALAAGSVPIGAFPLATVCILGFGLCPYLDATFLRTREQTEGRSGLVFTLGFGVFFASMIGLTAYYAPLLSAAGGAALKGPVRGWLAAHLLLQACYTVAAHAERRMLNPPPSGRRVPPAATALAAGLLVGIGYLSRLLPPLGPMPAGEVGYRLFLSFYGLVFPAYLLIGFMTSGWSPRPLSRSSWRGFVTALVLASPFYAIGFFTTNAAYLAPGVMVVAVVALITKATDRRHPIEPAPPGPST